MKLKLELRRYTPNSPLPDDYIFVGLADARQETKTRVSYRGRSWNLCWDSKNQVHYIRVGFKRMPKKPYLPTEVDIYPDGDPTKYRGYVNAEEEPIHAIYRGVKYPVQKTQEKYPRYFIAPPSTLENTMADPAFL